MSALQMLSLGMLHLELFLLISSVQPIHQLHSRCLRVVEVVWFFISSAGNRLLLVTVALVRRAQPCTCQQEAVEAGSKHHVHDEG